MVKEKLKSIYKNHSKYNLNFNWCIIFLKINLSFSFAASASKNENYQCNYINLENNQCN